MFFVECVDFGQDGVIFGDLVRTLELSGNVFSYIVGAFESSGGSFDELMGIFESSVVTLVDSLVAFKSRGIDFGQLGRCIWVQWLFLWRLMLK